MRLQIRKSARPSYTRERTQSLALAACILATTTGWALVEGDAIAANQEPKGLNLGLTSFYDGFGRNEEGFVYLNYLTYGMGRSINGDDGKALQIPTPMGPIPAFSNPQIDVFAFVNQLVYVLPEPLFDGAAHLGYTWIVPLVAFRTSFDPAPVQLKDNGVGFGDLTMGPFLQFTPTIVEGRPIFSHRLELDLVAPIGAYNPDKEINQGANFASFNPYWAGTVLPVKGLEISARLHYLFNATNQRPTGLAPPEGSTVRNAQAGMAFWVNFTVSYELIHKLHLGANGYYFLQFTDDQYWRADGSKVDPAATGDTGRASFLGIGPGLFWDIDKENKLMANVYFEPIAKNTTGQNVFNLHYIHSFY
jgi:hypothetical protein